MDWSWATEGISSEIPRTAGPECSDFMTNRRRIIETIIVSVLCIYAIKWALKRIEPIVVPVKPETAPSVFKWLLIISMTFIFGMEMGFKFAEKTVINALNPCHIQTIIQIYLLAAKPSKTSIALFRIQMNYLNGPFLAIMFPEIESRTLNLEQFTYWTQHALLYIIPVYLIRSGAYPPEKISNMYYSVISMAILLLYHFIFLGYISVISEININHMLCPALSDPFDGQQYRIAACIHESLLCPFLNKLTTYLFAKSNVLEPIEAEYDNNETNSMYKVNSKTIIRGGSVTPVKMPTTTARMDENSTKID